MVSNDGKRPQRSGKTLSIQDQLDRSEASVATTVYRGGFSPKQSMASFMLIGVLQLR